MPTAWVDFKAVKQGVSMEMALARYGIRLRRISREYLRGACPLPTHQSRSSTQSFTVNTERNIWSCQSASCIAVRGGSVGGNVLDFVAVMDGCSIRDAALSLHYAFSHAASPSKHCQERRARASFQGAYRSHKGTHTPLTFVLSGIDCRHPYVAGRGINSDVARLFGVGHYAGPGIMSGRIVIPIHSPEGALVAYAGRTIDGREPRYRFPLGFRKSQLLFNLHRAVKERDRRCVVLVEGFFDCMKVQQAGQMPVVALMGSTMSACQQDLLRENFDAVILMLDGDEAGRSATGVIAECLSRWVSVNIAKVPAGSQPDQLSAEQIQQIINEAKNP